MLDAARGRTRSRCRGGGVLHLLCFSDRQPGIMGPRRVTQHEIQASFVDGWKIVEIVAAEFETNVPLLRRAWRATIARAE